MRQSMSKAVLVILGFVIALPAVAETREEKRVSDAADVLAQLNRIPETTIPSALLARAYAVAVIPDVVKAGLGVGVRHGRGVLVVRQDNNSWSNPAFISLTGGSLGWQAGVQSTDVILVFKTRKGVDDISKGKLTLGADASVAAGPVGRHTEAATDLKLEAEIVSYSRSRGLFAGVSFEGSGVTMDRDANAAFYGSSTMTPDQIFVSSPNVAPDIANKFVQILTAQTSGLPTQPGMQPGAATAAPATAGEDSAGVRTFGIPTDDEAGKPQTNYE
jgi:lipid-binding SYLF domain-containing protein